MGWGRVGEEVGVVGDVGWATYEVSLYSRGCVYGDGGWGAEPQGGLGHIAGPGTAALLPGPRCKRPPQSPITGHSSVARDIALSPGSSVQREWGWLGGMA